MDTVTVRCRCGRSLVAPVKFAGQRAECRSCGETLRIPPPLRPAAAFTAPAADPFALEITEFFDPPVEPVEPVEAAEPPKPKKPAVGAMLEALLDPRSIQWMLMLGGGLSVLGLIVWLTSLGIFENTLVVAVAMGAGTLAVLGGGWALALKTRYRIAGQALTFLGCVLAPLNLWFYHAQGLVLLDQNLWIGGLVCCGLYAATVYVLRDPLFLYAVEAGITLTMLLLLGELGVASDVAWISLFLLGLGLISIHAERAFPPDGAEFPRARFGMPLFWSGQVQIAAALLCLLGSQIIAWILDPTRQWLGLTWEGNLLSESTTLAGGLWLAGAYAYVYSDLVVRRHGLYTYLAALCLILAQVTLVGINLQSEGLIVVLALTAVAANAAQSQLAGTGKSVKRTIAPLGLVLSLLPVFLGVLIHARTTSAIAESMGLAYQTGWLFVGAMLLVAVCNRISAYLLRNTDAQISAVYFFLSAAGLVVAAAGLLRAAGLEGWTAQAPILMVIPIGYLVAARLWRGHSPEQPLGWVAQATTAVILFGTLFASVETIGAVVRPVERQTANLLLGLVFVEAGLFYLLAAIYRRRSANILLAAAALCGAVWQFLGYAGIPGPYYTMLYAVLGVLLLAAARTLGLEVVPTYRADGEETKSIRGRGLELFQVANAILSIALLTAFLQGFMRLGGARATDWLGLGAMALTAALGGVAVVLVPPGGWRRWYATATIGLCGLVFLILNLMAQLSTWRKLEILCVAGGVLLVAAGYVGRFREREQRTSDTTSVGLWFGSLLVTIPLLVAVLHGRFSAAGISLFDELALLLLTVAMLVTGFSWQVKSTTLLGGGTLALYLMVLIVSLGYRPQVAIGVYLAIGGAAVFLAGIALSIYRERLLKMPEQIANREGVFRVLGWR